MEYKDDKPHLFFIFGVSIIFVAIILFLTGAFKEEYDPAKHDCDEWMVKVSSNSKISTECKIGDLQDAQIGIKEICVDKRFFDEYKECTKFHDKPFCEQCIAKGWTQVPEVLKNSKIGTLVREEDFKKCDERCICTEEKTNYADEYEIDNACPYYPYYCADSLHDDILMIAQTAYNCTINTEKRFVNKQCLSAREKTECEKGNKDWVEDCDKYKQLNSDCDLSNVTDAKDIYCVPIVQCLNKICRPKTDLEKFKEKLDSYDCEKLAEDIAEFDDCQWQSKCNYNYGVWNQKERIDYFSLKGCKL